MDTTNYDLALPSTDSVSAVAEFEQILASNSGEDSFDSAIQLLAAKLADELNVDAGEEARFALHKTPDATHKAVQDLYRQSLSRWPLLNGAAAKLEITPLHLVRTIRPLLGWRLRDSDLSLLDATLERLVSRDSKGALGQYFTPRAIIRLCADVLAPNPKDKVIDPACGSAGFLFESTRYSVRKFGTAPLCLGIDFGARAVKVAALLAAATPKARIVVSKENSLDGRAYTARTPPEWKPFLCRDTGATQKRAQSWGSWNRIGGTVLVTNPPFAGTIDQPDILDAFESQQFGSPRRAVSREQLFLERAVHLLRPGGRLAIVLPQGLLANASCSYLRRWLLTKCRILGVIGMHSHAFLPYTTVKTALLFAVKLGPQETQAKDYPIFFATSRNCGKDSRGRPVDLADYGDIAKSFSRFLVTQKFHWAVPPPRGDETADYETVPVTEVIKADRLDAEYFDASARALLRKFSDASFASLANFVDVRPERFKKASFREIRYIDISSVDNMTGRSSSVEMLVDDTPSRASYIVHPGDVLVSTVRPDRNVVGLITTGAGNPMVASNGFCVLRSRTVTPEVLFAYCKTDAFKTMLSRHATASMYPTVTDADVMSMPFLAPPEQLSGHVTKLVRTALQMVEQAHRQLGEAVSLMENHIQEPQSSAIIDGKPAPKAQQKAKRYLVNRRRR